MALDTGNPFHSPLPCPPPDDPPPGPFPGDPTETLFVTDARPPWPPEAFAEPPWLTERAFAAEAEAPSVAAAEPFVAVAGFA